MISLIKVTGSKFKMKYPNDVIELEPDFIAAGSLKVAPSRFNDKVAGRLLVTPLLIQIPALSGICNSALQKPNAKCHPSGIGWSALQMPPNISDGLTSGRPVTKLFFFE